MMYKMIEKKEFKSFFSFLEGFLEKFAFKEYDCKITCEGKEFFFHKSDLCQISDVFVSKFEYYERPPPYYDAQADLDKKPTANG